MVVWVHAIMRPVHFGRPTWVSQACRAALKSGARWSLCWQETQSGTKPLESLSQHKYVKGLVMQKPGVYVMGSESVDLDNLSENGVVSQVLLWQQNAVQPMCDRWLHEGVIDGQSTTKQRRAQEDVEAIGGLRSPHVSAMKLPATPYFSCWMEDMLCKQMPDELVCSEILATLGKEDTPSVANDFALGYRKAFCEALKCQFGTQMESRDLCYTLWQSVLEIPMYLLVLGCWKRRRQLASIGRYGQEEFALDCKQMNKTRLKMCGMLRTTTSRTTNI